jgi:hypothetical protein
MHAPRAVHMLHGLSQASSLIHVARILRLRFGCLIMTMLVQVCAGGGVQLHMQADERATKRVTLATAADCP